MAGAECNCPAMGWEKQKKLPEMVAVPKRLAMFACGQVFVRDMTTAPPRPYDLMLITFKGGVRTTIKNKAGEASGGY